MIRSGSGTWPAIRFAPEEHATRDESRLCVAHALDSRHHVPPRSARAPALRDRRIADHERGQVHAGQIEPPVRVAERAAQRVEDVHERVPDEEQRRDRHSGARQRGARAAQTSATPMARNAQPMSRTKCALNGPVSGTAAGSRGTSAADPRTSRARSRRDCADDGEDPAPRVERSRRAHGCGEHRRFARASGPSSRAREPIQAVRFLLEPHVAEALGILAALVGVEGADRVHVAAQIVARASAPARVRRAVARSRGSPSRSAPSPRARSGRSPTSSAARGCACPRAAP